MSYYLRAIATIVWNLARWRTIGSFADRSYVRTALIRTFGSWPRDDGSLLDERQSTTNYEEDLCQGLVSSLAANKNSLNLPRTGRSFVLYKFKNDKSEIKGDVKL